MHKDAGGDLPKVFSYNNFRTSWYAFLSLLNIDMPNGFICTECGAEPQIILMDATSLGFRKEFMLGSSTSLNSEQDEKAGR